MDIVLSILESVIIQFAALFLSPSFYIALGAVLIIIIIPVTRYRKTSYCKITKNPYFKTLSDTGLYGEYLTYRELMSLEKEGAKFLFNVYVPKKEGGYSEIDLLMISASGIFVFESKNYSGWIFGDGYSNYWTQTLPSGKGKSKKKKFLNPIHQNFGHISFLKEFLACDVPFYSIVVFSNRCEFKDLSFDPDSVDVINRSHVLSRVKKHMNKCRSLSENDITEIYEKLLTCTGASDEQKATHIASIKNTKTTASAKRSLHFTDEDDPPEESPAAPPAQPAEDATQPNPICPKCGVPLVLRTASRGEHKGSNFYGCPNFPKCRYILPITPANDSDSSSDSKASSV